jgi:type II secretion system protein J
MGSYVTRNERPSGFTLVEILVAVTIVVAIVSMVYGSYATTTKGMSVCQADMATSARARLALGLMAAQLRCAYLPHDPNEDEPMTSSLAAAAGRHGAPGLFWGDADDPRGNVLSFVTTSRTGGAQDARGLCHVTYRYTRSGGTLSIARRHWPADQRELETATGLPVLNKVRDLRLRFHDGYRWHDRWDIAARRALPRVVGIALLVADETGRQRRYATAVPVLCRPGSSNEGLRQRTRTRGQ